ncbi:hypothetical protein [Mucilaginibacter sp.]|uniref:hypothetical protein n=1 Tax=Mucilaginibacter sp. TaxID=1882438 RepID=UPI0028499141|nr:hypothetical protein [Mucilaginibacter sp.]MDR3697877.1 hypothetical protein [Mucilaginibacter sp.]
MIIIEKADNINAIKADDMSNINRVLFDSIYINDIYIKDSEVDYKEDMIDRFAEILNKMLLQNVELSDDAKLNIINLLDKLNTQKENLEMIKLKTSIADVQQASERLSKKSQSAFELK